MFYNKNNKLHEDFPLQFRLIGLVKYYSHRLAVQAEEHRLSPLREGKGTCWEGGVRIPAIMQWPSKIPAGSISSIPAMTIDILPTIAEITSAPLPELSIDGKNILPIILNEPEAESPHEAYYFY